jgi:nitroimidazol reductase NimA-like FMN-containing flavoprotein (pyridoxamine 5'-phosphate oxidase superfamily)
MTEDELAELARAVVDTNLYMTLGTADEAGRPWVSPVYYASLGYTEFVWVSSPEARHSRNIAVRPQVSVVIFDTHAPILTGQGVYMAARAEEVMGAELDRAIEPYSRRVETHGGQAFAREDVRPPARHRLYRATASEHFVLSANDERIPVNLA